jgi:CBS domain-containing protein
MVRRAAARNRSPGSVHSAGPVPATDWRQRAIRGIIGWHKTRNGRARMTLARVIAGKPVAEVFSAQANMTVLQAIAILAERRIGAMPVLDGNRLIGIFSERDVIYCAAREGAAALERPLREVMTEKPFTATPELSVLEALALMTRRRIRHLPVLKGEELVGIVSIGDLVKFRIDSIEREAEAMRAYIQSA